jgi:hypothetical protein
MRAYKLYLPPERVLLKMSTTVFAETLENLNILRALFPKAEIIR